MHRWMLMLVLFSIPVYAQDAQPQALHIGNDFVGESVAIYSAHDRDCFKSENLHGAGMTSFGAVSECLVSIKKGETFTLAGVAVIQRNVVMEGEHVVAMGYQFKRHDYPVMRAAFVKEFGVPTKSKIERGEGGCYGERVAWKNEISVVNLQECNKDGISIAAFGLLDFVQRTSPPKEEPPSQ